LPKFTGIKLIPVKKISLLIIAITTVIISYAQPTRSESRQQKAADRRDHVNQLIKQEEEGALIYEKQSAFGLKFNTDGFSLFYEHGKYKTITKTNLWWVELGERKDKHQERTSAIDYTSGGISSYVYGKENNFYFLRAGIGQQRLIGNKGNKNGVAVSAIYGAGLSLGMLKPYYLQEQLPNGSQGDVKYSDNNALFLDYNNILGASGFTKGLGEIQFVPGITSRAALRFDYGRYNELLSAIEVGLNLEYYTKEMQIMVQGSSPKLFFNAYAAIVFGKRK